MERIRERTENNEKETKRGEDSEEEWERRRYTQTNTGARDAVLRSVLWNSEAPAHYVPWNGQAPARYVG